MPSRAAEENLKLRVEEWEDFRKNYELPPIDLTFLRLPDFDLTRRDFSDCDLTGAEIQGCSLDNAIFNSTILRGSNLSNTGIIDCNFEAIICENTNFSYALIRNTKFVNIKFVNTDFSGTNIDNSVFRSCQFENCQFENSSVLSHIEFESVTLLNVYTENATLNFCKFKDVNIAKFVSLGSRFINCTFRDAIFDEFTNEKGEFGVIIIDNSRVNKLHLNNTITYKIDLTNSIVSNMNIKHLNPSSATFFNTAFFICQWPLQEGKVSLFGKYHPSPYLIRQPVQDIRGLDPILRREIADAQYLVSLIDNADGILEKMFIRLWGLSTAYGQSALRLTFFFITVNLILAFVLQLLDIDSLSFTKEAIIDYFNAYWNHFRLLFAVSLSLEEYASSSISSIEEFVRIVVITGARILGYIVLGLWMTIVSNNIVNLSAE